MKVETFIYRAANHTGILCVPQAQQPLNVPTESNRGAMNTHLLHGYQCLFLSTENLLPFMHSL